MEERGLSIREKRDLPSSHMDPEPGYPGNVIPTLIFLFTHEKLRSNVYFYWGQDERISYLSLKLKLGQLLNY